MALGSALASIFGKGKDEGGSSLLSKLIPAGVSAVGGILNDRAGSKRKDKGTTTENTSSTQTATSEFGEQGQGLIEALLPIIQRLSQSGSVNPGVSERIANSQFQQTNAQADNLTELLTGANAAQGLTYSAPTALARGQAEQFRGSQYNDIIQNQGQNDINIARDNRQEQVQGAGLGTNLLQLLPQSRTQTNVGQGTIASEGQSNISEGSTLGNILKTGADFYNVFKRLQGGGSGQQNRPSLLNAVGGNPAPPNLAYQPPNALPTGNNPLVKKPPQAFVSSTVKY